MQSDIAKKITSLFSSFFYPKVCLHCNNLFPGEGVVCEECSHTLDLLSPYCRCRRCFSVTYTKKCSTCAQGLSLNKRGAAFPYSGLARSLVHYLKFCSYRNLAQGLSAYLFVQLERFGWEGIDCVVPMPQSPLHKMMRGYNPAALLATELALLLEVPVCYPLGRRLGAPPQAFLAQEQRKLLASKEFTPKRQGGQLADRTILLIDDVMTTGSTLNACAKALWLQAPSKIYGLTLCMTE